MTAPDTPISKTLLVNALKACCTHEKDEQNDKRFIYQTGRNSVAEYLLMEIAFGSFEFPAMEETKEPVKGGIEDMVRAAREQADKQRENEHYTGWVQKEVPND